MWRFVPVVLVFAQAAFLVGSGRDECVLYGDTCLLDEMPEALIGPDSRQVVKGVRPTKSRASSPRSRLLGILPVTAVSLSRGTWCRSYVPLRFPANTFGTTVCNRTTRGPPGTDFIAKKS